MRLDQVMLGKMRGDAEVGIYSVVVLIAEAVYIVPMIGTKEGLPVELDRVSQDRITLQSGGGDARQAGQGFPQVLPLKPPAKNLLVTAAQGVRDDPQFF